MGRLVVCAPAIFPCGGRLLARMRIGDRVHHETQSRIHFQGRRFAGVDLLVELVNLRLVGLRLLEFRPGHQRLRLLDDERIVHHEQRLLRHGGDVALRAGLVGRGKIERMKNTGQILPVDEPVDRAAFRVRRGGDFHGTSAHRGIELSRDGEQRIAHRFEIEPAAVHVPEEAVLRVGLRGIGAQVAGLLIRARKHDRPVQLLDRPPLAHEA